MVKHILEVYSHRTTHIATSLIVEKPKAAGDQSYVGHLIPNWREY
jgi:hypothetical protein